MRYKFIVFALAFVLCLTFASAANFDNAKVFKDPSNIKEVTIENKFGWFDEEIATVRLDTPLYNYVPAGHDVLIAEITINNIESYKSALQKVESYDLRKGGKKENGREFTFKIKGTDMVEVPVYDSYNNFIGTNIVEQVTWTSLGNKDLSSGETTIGIFTDTTAGELFDYVPTLFGEDIEEWAVVSVTETIQGGAWANAAISNGRGWNITLQEAVNVTAFILEGSVSGATRALIRNADNTVTLFSTTTLVGQTFFFGGAGANLSAGNYRFLVDNSGGGYTGRRLTGESLPQDTGIIEWIMGANEAVNDDGFSIQSIVFNQSFPENVSAAINFPRGNPSYNTQQINFSYNVSGLNANVSNASIYLFNQNLTDLNNDASCVLHLTLDGNTVDSCGGENNGTLVNSPQPVEGMIGGAYSGDGTFITNRTIQTNIAPANNPTINLSSMNWSICSWINTLGNNSRTLNQQPWGSYGGSAPETVLQVNLYPNASQVTNIQFSTRNSTTTRAVVYNTDTELNNWVHTCVTLNRNNNISQSLFINGNLIESNIGASGVIATTNITLFRSITSDPATNRYFNGSIDDVRIYNRSLSAAEIFVLYNQTQPVHKEVGINAPSRSFLNASINNTPEGQWNWTVYANGFSNITSNLYVQSFSSVESFTIDQTTPTALLMPLPVNNSYFYTHNASDSNFTLNITNVDASPGFCAFNSTFNPTLTLVACNSVRQVNLTNVFGKHTIYGFGNDTAGNMRMNQTTFWIHRNLFDNETYETDTETISLELWNLTAAPTSPVLTYNGTNLTPTITNMGNSKYSLNTTLDIALGSGNRSFIHYYNDGVARVSDPLNQMVNTASFSMCTAETPPKYLNISFKNETVSQEVVNASIASSLFTYWLGSGAVTKNYSFSTATEQRNYTFCFTPGHRNITATESISYANSLSAQRTFSSTLSLSNTTTQQTLYLLPNSLGIYVTFQVINPALQPIEGVLINISSSAFGAIETKTTDASGAATFFLNPLVSYNIVATKSGLPSYSTTLTPTQTDYTITMGLASTNTTVQDYFRGITYSISPSQIYLTNSTSYQFNFTIASSYWTLDSFGMSIRNGSGSQYGTNSSTANTGGTVSLNRNVGSNTTLIVDAYWVIQGNTTNVSKTYTIFDSSGSGTSLANLRDRITLYIQNGGFFGLTPFGLNIIVFLIIFSVTGLASWKFGFTSPVAVFATMFVVTMVFDIMNFITYADALPDGAASLMTGILTLGFAIREAVN